MTDRQRECKKLTILTHIKASRLSAGRTDKGAEYEQADVQANDEFNGEG